jgi:hypothetical protein
MMDMAAIKNFLKLNVYLSNHALITDLIAKFTITFGVVLIVGGLYLMVGNPGAPIYVVQTTQVGNQIVLTVVDWIPGVPFYVGDLANLDAVVAGSAYWIVGVDLLLVGLGLWVRHKFARLAGIIIFGIAAFFNFTQLMLSGLLGSPVSVLVLLINGIFVYLLFSKFDAPTAAGSHMN